MSKKTDTCGGRFKETKKTNYSDYFKTRKYRDEKKDDEAMNIDAMSTEKRITLMKKGACFICEKPRHMANDHDEYVKKTRKENARGTTSFPPKKKNISEIHALLQGLTNEETKELMALQSKGEEKKDDDDEDF